MSAGCFFLRAAMEAPASPVPKPGRSCSEPRARALASAPAAHSSGAGASWKDSSWPADSWRQPSSWKDSSWTADSWRESSSWSQGQWGRSSSTGNVSRRKPDKPSRSSHKPGKVEQSSRHFANGSQRRHQKPFELPLHHSQQFPDLRASLTGDSPQRKNKLFLPRASSSGKTARADTKSSDEMHPTPPDPEPQMTAGGEDGVVHLPDTGVSTPEGGLRCAAEADPGDEDCGAGECGDAAEFEARAPGDASAEAVEGGAFELIKEADRCELAAGSTGTERSSSTVGSDAGGLRCAAEADPGDEDCGAGECRDDAVLDTRALGDVSAETVEAGALELAEEADRGELAAGSTSTEGGYDAGDEPAVAEETDGHLRQDDAPPEADVPPLEESGVSGAVTEVLADELASDNSDVISGHGEFSPSGKVGECSRIPVNDKIPKKAAPLKRLTRGASADSYIGRLQRDQEIQRINCCRSAAAVLELPASALQDRHAVMIAYLAKAWLLHSFPAAGEKKQDAEHAVTLLSGAFKHCTDGSPWRHGHDLDASAECSQDAFDLFSRVAQAAIDSGEIEADLVASCKAVLSRPRTSLEISTEE